jgi:hypothetical protein
MPQNAVVVKNMWILVVIGILLCLGSCGVIWAFSAFSTPTGNGSTSSSKTSSTSANSSSAASSAPPFVITREFKFAGIKQDRTVVLFGGGEPEFTIELDDMAWRNLQFSTDNTFISGLAKQTSTSKRDIYLYKISAATWEKITPYGSTDSGVEIHLWENKDNILFIQGSGNQRWLHRYNLLNREVSKLFPLTQQVYALAEGKLIVVDNLKEPQIVRALSLKDGGLLWEVSSAQLQAVAGASGKIDRIAALKEYAMITLRDSAGLYHLLKFDGTTISLVTSITQTPESSTSTSSISTSMTSSSSISKASSSSLPRTSGYALQLVCVIGEKLWGWDQTMPGLLSIVEFDLNNLQHKPLYTQLVSTESTLDLNSVQCTGNKILFKLDRSSSQSAWYLVSSLGGSAISTNSIFTELVTGN